MRVSSHTYLYCRLSNLMYPLFAYFLTKVSKELVAPLLAIGTNANNMKMDDKAIEKKLCIIQDYVSIVPPLPIAFGIIPDKALCINQNLIDSHCGKIVLCRQCPNHNILRHKKTQAPLARGRSSAEFVNPYFLYIPTIVSKRNFPVLVLNTFFSKVLILSGAMWSS